MFSEYKISFLILVFGHIALYSFFRGMPGTTMKGSFSLPRLTNMAYMTLAEKVDCLRRRPYPLQLSPVTLCESHTPALAAPGLDPSMPYRLISSFLPLPWHT